jgi:hypothetical protein
LTARARFIDCTLTSVKPGSYRVALITQRCETSTPRCPATWRRYPTSTLVDEVEIVKVKSTKFTLRADPSTGIVRAGTSVQLTLYSASTWTDGTITTASAATKACSRIQFRSSSKALWKDVDSSARCQAKVWPSVSGQWRFLLRNGTPLEAIQIRVK